MVIFGSCGFEIGDVVRVKYREQEGVIIGIDGDYYTVSINDGQMVDSFEADELERA